MASFHFSAQILKRSKGHSAVAAAAYRSRCQLKDERTGQVQDYRRKDGLHHSEILLPEGAAPFLADRERLWNYVEGIEKRADAQLAREINLALPAECSDAERLQLVRDFARAQFVSQGMVVDFAIHHPVPGAKVDQRNVHAHLMLTLRRATATGLDPVKTRAWNSDKLLVQWRAAWAEAQNLILARAGHRARVDHRTLEAQKAEALARGDRTAAAVLDRKPEVHVGPRAAAAAYRGLTPESRDRQAQTRQQPRKRSGPERPKSAKRTVRYPEFDQGSRQAWNRQLVDRNLKRLTTFSEKRESQLVRFRQHEVRALRLAKEFERQIGQASRPSGWGIGKGTRRPSEPLALLEARRIRALNRAVLARRLVSDIEAVLARTLGVQRHHHDRHRVFSRTWRDDALIQRQRGRGRTPRLLG